MDPLSLITRLSASRQLSRCRPLPRPQPLTPTLSQGAKSATHQTSMDELRDLCGVFLSWRRDALQYLLVQHIFQQLTDGRMLVFRQAGKLAGGEILHDLRHSLDAGDDH